MNALPTKPAELKLPGDGAKPFTAVVAYDDAQGLSNAKEFYSWLAGEFGDKFDLEFRWWSFDQLRPACAAENAVAMAMEADLVIISTASEDLPAHAKLWIETSLIAKGEQDLALVGLIPTAHARRGSPAAHDYLERLAQQWGLSYFAHLLQLPEAMPACTVENLQIRADTVTPLLKEILRFPPSPHWGINE